MEHPKRVKSLAERLAEVKVTNGRVSVPDEEVGLILTALAEWDHLNPCSSTHCGHCPRVRALWWDLWVSLPHKVRQAVREYCDGMGINLPRMGYSGSPH